MTVHMQSQGADNMLSQSDTETKGLRQAIGKIATADSLLRGCNVHWARSYQRVAVRVNSRVQKCNKK